MQEKALRRRKRKTKANGDRQYFAAVRHIRRAKLDKWMMVNSPEKFARRASQLIKQAQKRETKQKEKDEAKAALLASASQTGTTINKVG
jgi:hypothetical protein